MERIFKFSRQTFSSLKVKNYRLYFIGQAISLCGNWMQTIGQSWLVLKLTGSGTALGLTAALQFLPVLILGPLGGVIVDRFSKRKILYFTQSAAGALALALGILVATGLIKLWTVYLLALALGLVNAVDNPARQVFVTEMVGKNQLANALSLNSVEINLARVIGPVIAGALIATVGLASCFIINAVSFVAVVIVLFMMREKDLYLNPLVTQVKGQLMEGFRYIKSSPLLRNILLMMAIIGTLTYEFSVILPLLAKVSFHGSAGTYAALTAAMGLGSAFGGIYTASRRKIAPYMLTFAAFFFGVTVLLTALMPNLPLAMASLVLTGFFSINFLSLVNTTLQLESAPEMRGRVMALYSVAFLGTTPIGGPIIGLVGENFGPRWGLVVGGIAALTAAGLGALTLNKNKYPPLAAEAVEPETSSREDAKIL